MQHLINSTRQAVSQENWYSALALALTMPDICGRISYPALAKQSEKRYVAWFDAYLAETYRGGWNRMQLMKGEDLYALRCAYLHQGEFDLTGQNVRKVLERFHIEVPGTAMHRNLLGQINAAGELTDAVLQLRVDMFCEDVCVGVEKWLLNEGGDPRISAEIAKLGTLRPSGSF